MSEDKAPYQTSTRSLLEKLGKPFPKEAIKTRVGGGGARFDYVAGFTVIHRLNDATGGKWSWHVKSFDFRPAGTDKYGKEVSLVVVTGELTIDGLGTRAGIGVQKVTENGGEDLVKGASTDALKKAATLFGVALELYGDDYEDEDRAPARPVPRQQVYASSQPAPTPRAASQAAPTNGQEHPLLAVIRDDTADPKKRRTALHNYYMTATTIKALDRCAEAVKGMGLPTADLTGAYNWHADRIEPKAAALPHPGHAG